MLAILLMACNTCLKLLLVVLVSRIILDCAPSYDPLLLFYFLLCSVAGSGSAPENSAPEDSAKERN